jgi:hypothetical protein
MRRHDIETSGLSPNRWLPGFGAAPSGMKLLLLPLLVLLFVLQGCATPPERSRPLPPELGLKAEIPNIPHARQWGDDVPEEGFARWLALPDEELRRRYGGIMDRSHNYLIISGGGSHGAFGAGLLVGWTAEGSRPEFEIVTGISTGALIAPFAFLGTAYDPALRQIYTGYSTADLIERRSLLAIVRGDAAVSTAPLRRLIAEFIDEAIVAAIAAEGRKGRSLLIGTTHLDAARPVIWDITRIAASGTPQARDLIHDVMLASASIPGAFPPVLIEVEAEGQIYDEMHVDGGVTSQLFLSPAGLDWSAVKERLRVQGEPNLFLIRNARLAEPWQIVPPRLGPVVTRTISTLIRSQGIGDLARVYIAAAEHGLKFHLAYVPTTFVGEATEIFDANYMRQLFDLGYELARKGYPWTES